MSKSGDSGEWSCILFALDPFLSQLTGPATLSPPRSADGSPRGSHRESPRVSARGPRKGSPEDSPRDPSDPPRRAWQVPWGIPEGAPEGIPQRIGHGGVPPKDPPRGLPKGSPRSGMISRGDQPRRSPQDDALGNPPRGMMGIIKGGITLGGVHWPFHGAE